MRATVVLVLLSLAVVRLSGAFGVSSVVLNEDTVRIVVPVTVVSESPILDRWQRGIDRAWNYGNDGKPFQVCGRSVVFNAAITVGNTTGRADSHVLLIRPAGPGRHVVSSVWHTPGLPPTHGPRKAVWASTLPPHTAAHEFGHLLGLSDEYVDADDNGNGKRDPGEGSRPDESRYPDAWLSLMAFEGGVVLERHVHEVLRVHGAGEALSCLEPPPPAQ